MELKRELGKNIQKYRKLNKITQEKLAELIGVEINSISSIETGKYFPFLRIILLKLQLL